MPKKFRIPGVPNPEDMLRALKEARERDVEKKLAILDAKADADGVGLEVVKRALSAIKANSKKRD